MPDVANVVTATQPLHQFIYIAFGWLLGLLAPAIVEKIRQRYRTKSLKAAMAAELHELQYLMALVSYKLNDYSGLLTDEFLGWLDVILQNYKGDEPAESMRQLLPRLREVSAADRYATSYPRGDEGRGVGLIEYNLPLLSAHVNELLIMPLDFQTWALRITKKLDMLNQRSVHLQKKLDETFNPALSAQNHDNLVADLKAGYKDVATQAKKIADLISLQPLPWYRRIKLPCCKQ